nr:hypothetical protein [Tanacetum cinerariifolium]
MEDRVMLNNSKGKKQEVEDQRRNVKLSKNKTTQMPIVVPVSTREPKCTVKQFVAKPLMQTVASESNQKPRNITRKLYERVSKACSWWYPKFTPSGYKWKPKSEKENVNLNVSMPLGTISRTANILEHTTSRRSTGSNTPLSSNSFASQKFLGTVKFRNDQIEPILGYRDLVQVVVMIKRVYYVEGLNHNLFSVGQFCDADLEVASQKSTCYILDLKGNDLLIASINGKRYVLVIIDDYSRYTWTHFLRSKDETPEVLIDFLRLVQRGLHAQVRTVQTYKSTEFLNKTLHAYFASEGILHQTSVARTPEQNEISRAYRVFNRRTRVIVETIYVNFDELPQMASDHVSSDPAPECQRMALEHDNLSPGPQSQENVTQADKTVTTSNELDLLFSLIFDELLNGSSKVVSKSSAESTADAPNQRQQHTTPLNTHTTHAPKCQFQLKYHLSHLLRTESSKNG